MCTSRPPTLSSTDSTDIELATNKDLEQQPHARQRGDIELATNRDLEPHARQGVAERAPMQSQLRQLLALALPIMLSCMLSFLMPVVDLLFVGHLGTHELAAAALGDTVFKTVALPLQGFASALDTFLSQSYGAGRLDAYGRWAHVGTLVMLGLSVPCMLFLALAEQLLLAIGMVRCPLVQLAARCSVATCTHARPLRPPCYPILCGSPLGRTPRSPPARAASAGALCRACRPSSPSSR